jgi:UDP-N-acetylglucosamine 4,6-dehydratase
MKIVDLARAIAPEATLDVVGIRPGEKLHEVLISEDEARATIELEDMFVVQPSQVTWFGQDWKDEGQTLPAGFRFGSDNNPNWLTVSQIQEMVAPFDGPQVNGYDEE